jgi:hypothetical protein
MPPAPPKGGNKMNRYLQSLVTDLALCFLTPLKGGLGGRKEFLYLHLIFIPAY